MFPPLLHELTVWNTSKCNFKCNYCFVYSLYTDIPKQEMTVEVMDALIDFAKFNLMRDGKIWFFGGEPFTSFETMKYITEKCVANNLKVGFGVTTNCYLLDEEKLKWMRKYNYGILCSIDGTENLHDRHRKLYDGSGTWKTVWENIKLVRKILTPEPQIRWTVNVDTVEGLTEAMKFFIKEGLTNLAIDCVYEVKWDEDCLKILRGELEKMGELLLECYSNNIPVFSMFIRDVYDAYTRTNEKVRANWLDRCGLGTGSVGISPRGEILPCHRFVSGGKPVIGSVFRGFSPERIYIVERWRKLPPYSEHPSRCLDCKVKYACIGGCLACNYDLFGDLHIVPESYCEIKNLAYEVLIDVVRKSMNYDAFKRLYGAGIGRGCIE